MTGSDDDRSMFRALLRHHRSARGMSQLDLSLAAEVSARHISFLETGRARPSREMTLRLAAALGMSLRDTNALLRAAGMSPAFRESPIDAPLSPAIERALSRMLEHHEPYPMAIMNHRYDVLRMNQGTGRLLLRFIQDPTAVEGQVNAMHALFDPRLMRPFVQDWPRLARGVLTRLQRDALERPGDNAIRELVDSVCNYPDVPEDWREPAFDLDMTPTLELALERDGQRARFLTTLTVFNAPLDVTLEELKIESYFPLDAETEALCARMG